MGGTIEFSSEEIAYLKAATKLRLRFPEAAAYLEELAYRDHIKNLKESNPEGVNSSFPYSYEFPV